MNKPEADIPAYYHFYPPGNVERRKSKRGKIPFIGLMADAELRRDATIFLWVIFLSGITALAIYFFGSPAQTPSQAEYQAEQVSHAVALSDYMRGEKKK